MRLVHDIVANAEFGEREVLFAAGALEGTLRPAADLVLRQHVELERGVGKAPAELSGYDQRFAERNLSGQAPDNVRLRAVLFQIGANFFGLFAGVDHRALARFVQANNLAPQFVERAHILRRSARFQRYDFPWRKLRVRARKRVEKRRPAGIQTVERFVCAALQRALFGNAFPALQHGLHGFAKAELFGAERFVNEQRFVQNDQRAAVQIVQHRFGFFV
ncbi:hypothetical protein SDC9_69378 [bioreactor metagenome]|uniref:Uncharacterized protein n=1 Tax=bioreactor metagenome TaxID=1076179 RepID=A0A644Y4R2_9ZZZZ